MNSLMGIQHERAHMQHFTLLGQPVHSTASTPPLLLLNLPWVDGVFQYRAWSLSCCVLWERLPPQLVIYHLSTSRETIVRITKRSLSPNFKDVVRKPSPSRSSTLASVSSHQWTLVAFFFLWEIVTYDVEPDRIRSL